MLTTTRRVLITGGAGFIGSNVAVGLARLRPSWTLVALDNLRRRGSELNLARLHEAGVDFVHGDIRVLDDVLARGGVRRRCRMLRRAVRARRRRLCRAREPRRRLPLPRARATLRRAARLPLDQPRLPDPPARGSRLRATESRFELAREQPIVGASEAGIAEDFPLAGARTLYGTTKLAAELLIEEYRAAHGIQAVINRCGVVAGPWQMGKVDQGVFTHWMLAHHFGRDLRYIGFGGSGKQVRDLLHVDDLLELVARQLDAPAHWDGVTVNVGGGRTCSLSLLEATALCAEISGREVAVGALADNRPGDIPIYLSDCSRLFSLTDWRPARGPREILTDIHAWIVEHEAAVRAAL